MSGDIETAGKLEFPGEYGILSGKWAAFGETVAVESRRKFSVGKDIRLLQVTGV